MKYLPYGRQYIDSTDVREVIKVLRSDFITQGPKVEDFEKAIARYCQAKFAVCVSSGTAALHIACLAAGLKRGDEAVTTPITFAATANSIIYSGARPVFADIDYETVNISPEDIEKKITNKTRAILPVHMAGLACKIESIASIACKKGIRIIEDGCHALGAQYRYNNKWIKVGSCTHSDMTVFSFHPVKAITTGEGGAITTNDKTIYKRLLALRSHGIYKSVEMQTQYGNWHYEMRELGFNYRLTDFACALGLSQLKKLDTFIEKRNRIASLYDSKIKGIDRQLCASDKKHAYHLYLLKIDFENYKTTRKDFVNKMSSFGIQTQLHYIPVYRHPYYRKNYPPNPAAYPNSEKYYKRAVSIPIFPAMSLSDAKRVTGAINSILSK